VYISLWFFRDTIVVDEGMTLQTFELLDRRARANR
jgi:hypothetical protein